jgi:hypothetical protein
MVFVSTSQLLNCQLAESRGLDLYYDAHRRTDVRYLPNHNFAVKFKRFLFLVREQTVKDIKKFQELLFPCERTLNVFLSFWTRYVFPSRNTLAPQTKTFLKGAPKEVPSTTTDLSGFCRHPLRYTRTASAWPQPLGNFSSLNTALEAALARPEAEQCVPATLAGVNPFSCFLVFVFLFSVTALPTFTKVCCTRRAETLDFDVDEVCRDTFTFDMPRLCSSSSGKSCPA